MIINIVNGFPNYLINYSGLISGTETSIADGDFTISNLPSGDYTVQVTDAQNCIDSIIVTVPESNCVLNLRTIDIQKN